MLRAGIVSSFSGTQHKAATARHPCTGCAGRRRPQPRLALTLRFSGLRLTARLQPKPKPPPSEQTLGEQRRLSRKVRALGDDVSEARQSSCGRQRKATMAAWKHSWRGAPTRPRGSGAQSRKVQREFAAVMLAWFELFCVTLVVETAITHKIWGFEAQSCPGLRFAPKRKGASERVLATTVFGLQPC